MEPLTSIELATCTLSELVTLYCAIETELWIGRLSQRQHEKRFADKERIRRALADRARSR